jgi:hypothetical protein
MLYQLIANFPSPTDPGITGGGGGKGIGTIDGIGNFLPSAAGGAASSTTGMQIDNIFSTMITFLTIVAGLAFLIYFIIGA